MFSLSNMPSTTTVLSTYTTFAASAVLIRTVINEVQNVTNHLIPKGLQDKIMSKLEILMGNLSSTMCIIINETTNGYSKNEVFEAAEAYLRTRISLSVNHLKVSKVPRDKTLLVTINQGEDIVDNFDCTLLKWKLTCTETQKTNFDGDVFSNENVERRSFELRFDKKFRDKVLDSYLPFVLKRSKEINEASKAVRLHALGFYSEMDGAGPWGSVNLDHPSTFDTLAMDPAVKNELIEDLNRFARMRHFYRRVGKAWKRGYLLYGPPGTGKSSLIAAMANYLKFDVYDLELAHLNSNSELRRLVVSTKNKSILVIEDIDCSIDIENREDGGYNPNPQSQLTLSGLLNFIDGLWSSYGDERIIIFTTNHKDRLDPALLRPGRMDMHIHMSYCTFSGFKILASNYLGIKSHSNHSKFDAIERMIAMVEVTPAEIAEELMKSEDVEIALDKVVELLRKKRDRSVEEIKDVAEEKEREIKEEREKKVIGKKRKLRRRRSRQ
ncbi:AAA+-type ATPase [Handroanthus impetiginosus]|uniref:AAA+-type ATPase n=1 Tax=Handroanthus impetiginosus TaxID=429701 RepID=A0A2G9FX16_9LAMI|nr:AAA+-type ATPase [Handroanthus impetiginosus]